MTHENQKIFEKTNKNPNTNSRQVNYKIQGNHRFIFGSDSWRQHKNTLYAKGHIHLGLGKAQ